MAKVKVPVRLAFPGEIGVGAVEVGGVDLAPVTRRLSLGVAAGRPIELSLDLVPSGGFTFDGQAHVSIDGELREALIALGWTPPAPDPE